MHSKINRKINRKDKKFIKRKHISPYARIDWKKTAELFNRVDTKTFGKRFKTSDILRILAKAADDGLMFVFNADNPAIVEYSLFGTGPLTWEDRKIIKRFEKQNYVTIKENLDGSKVIKITRRGLTKALSYQLDTMKLKKEKWDHKWRVIIFDVPEKYKGLRDLFRMRLRQLGLYPLQESVFVSPYKCFDEIEFLRELYGIGFTVRHLLVEQIEEDESLRFHFDL